MNLFNIKLLLTTSFIADPILNQSRNQDNDSRILNIIKKLDYNYNEVLENRKKIEGEILNLQGKIKTLNQSEDIKIQIENKNLVEIHKFENLLRKQINDVKIIITQLKRLIENEYLDLFFDIKIPLKLFEDFLNHFNLALKSISFNEHDRKEIYNILNEIYKEYGGLIDTIISQIIVDFNKFKKLGINLKNFINNIESDYALETFLSNKINIKIETYEKINSIKSKIEQIIKNLKNMNHDRKLNNENIKMVITSLLSFKKEFEQLIITSTDRVKLANFIVIESIVLQRDYLEKLNLLKNELNDFYIKFKQDSANKSKDLQTFADKDHVNKTKDLFDKFEKQVFKDLTHFENTISNKITKIKKEDFDNLNIEEKEAKRVINRMQRFKKSTSKVLIGCIIGLSLFGSASTSAIASDLFANKNTSITQTSPYTDQKLERMMNQPCDVILRNCIVTYVNDNNYQKEVLESDKHVMVLFYADNLNMKGINPSRSLSVLTNVLNKKYPLIKFCAYKVIDANKVPKSILKTIGFKYPLKKIPSVFFYKKTNNQIILSERINGGFLNFVEYNKFIQPIEHYIKSKLIYNNI